MRIQRKGLERFNDYLSHSEIGIDFDRRSHLLYSTRFIIRLNPLGKKSN